MLQRLFHLQERGTDVRTEVAGGLTTFLTMAYIVFVNPQVLSFFGDPALVAKGLPVAATASATALTAGLLCIAMGLFANVPVAMAAGMGLNAFVSYQLVASEGLPMSSAMGIVVLEGFVILLLVVSGLREAVMNAIPMELKKGIAAGIGLFIAFIGLQEAGFVKASPATMVTLGNLTTWPVLVASIGFLLTIVLLERRAPGALLWAILGTTAVAVAVNYGTGGTAFPPGVARLPESPVRLPDFSTLGKFDFGAFAQVGVLKTALLAFALMLSDFFDTMGSVIAVGTKAGLVDERGRMANLKRVLLVDSAGAILGGASSSASATCYIESVSGVAQGARTGLMTVVVGFGFLASLFLGPVIGMVPKEATAPVLVVVGFLMMSTLEGVDFNRFDTAFPAFLTLIGIPLTFSISSGIGLGFLAYALVRLLTGRAREVHPLLYAVSVAFLVEFLLPLFERL